MPPSTHSALPPQSLPARPCPSFLPSQASSTPMAGEGNIHRGGFAGRSLVGSQDRRGRSSSLARSAGGGDPLSWGVAGLWAQLEKAQRPAVSCKAGVCVHGRNQPQPSHGGCILHAHPCGHKHHLLLHSCKMTSRPCPPSIPTGPLLPLWEEEQSASSGLSSSKGPGAACPSDHTNRGPRGCMPPTLHHVPPPTLSHQCPMCPSASTHPSDSSPEQPCCSMWFRDPSCRRP